MVGLWLGLRRGPVVGLGLLAAVAIFVAWAIGEAAEG
jgi:hypothetical protein